jgi:CRP/FNR family cyclic AMP-dependent transcriptional regulator
METSRIEAAQRTAMFGAISSEVVELLCKRANEVTIDAGEHFFRQGERGSSAFLLESGVVLIHKQWEGEEYLLRRLESGDCFGEVALLDFGPRSASVRAETRCTALEISARDLRSIANESAEQFALIYMNLGRELSRRLRDADERIFLSKIEHSPISDGYTFAAV